MFKSKAYFFLVFLVIFSFFPEKYFAQNPPKTKFWVQFKDKNNSPYSTGNPSEFLSPRAILRREIQGISIAENDLPVNPAYLDSLRNAGALILNSGKWLNGATILLSDTNTSPAILNTISSFSFVNGVDGLKRLASLTSGSVIKDKFNETFSDEVSENFLKNYNYGNAFNQIDMLEGNILHSLGYRGEGKVIAVLDAGFQNVDQNPAFDSLRARNKILGTWDFVERNSSVYEDHYHGAMVLSLMGANVPGKMIGTAPDASFWLLRSEDAATESIIEEYNWVSAAEFADSVGADIISSSLGYSTFDYGIHDHSTADMDGETTPAAKGAETAFSKGILVVNSAGNEGSLPWRHIITPADGHDVIAVGAVDSAGVYAKFSSQGPPPDGVGTKPNVATQGSQAFVVTPDDRVISGNGTSFSCPILSGMAACLWQAAPSTATNIQVKEAIEQSASHYAFPDNFTGFGIPNFTKAMYILNGKNSSEFNKDYLFVLSSNPFSSSLSFDFYSLINQEITITLFDVVGRIVLKYTFNADRDSFRLITIPDSEDAIRLINGIYFLNISSLKGNQLLKVIKIGH